MSFKTEQAKIAKKERIPMKNAGAILASSSRNASPAAKRKNKNLAKVKGEINMLLFGVLVVTGFVVLIITAQLHAAPTTTFDTVKQHYTEAMTQCAAEQKGKARVECETRVREQAAPTFKFYGKEEPKPATTATRSKEKK